MAKIRINLGLLYTYEHVRYIYCTQERI